MILVVGGHARKVGKTRAACDIISATREACWTAVKISPHTHDSSPGGDTQRYLEAGACAAYLLAPGDELPAAPNLLIESNSVLDTLTPDLFLFVLDPDQTEWKESAARVAARADLVVERRIDEDILRLVREKLTAPRP